MNPDRSVPTSKENTSEIREDLSFLRKTLSELAYSNLSESDYDKVAKPIKKLIDELTQRIK